MRARLPLPRATLALVLAAGLVSWAETSAHAASSEWVGDAHAAVRLITRDDAVGRAPTVDAGLEFRLAPGWHGYWRTPGDAGLPPMVDWSGSDNVNRGDLSWPAPTRLVVDGLQNSVYEGHFVLPATLAVTTPGAPTTLRATIGYAACSNICVPYQADLTLALPAGPATTSSEAPLLAKARADVPGTLDAAGIEIVAASFSKVGAVPTLAIELRSGTEPFLRPDLFVEGAGTGLPGPPRVDLWEGGRAARLSVALPDTASITQPLTLTFTDGARAATFVQRPSERIASSTGVTTSTWLVALLSALLGGLILNLMPCVLPVLSVKLLGLVRQAGAGQRAMRLGLVATALGVVTSFLLLASVLIALQWSGVSLGWGVQFQQPWFLAGMASLTVLFAASLLDWISIGLPSTVMTAMAARPRGRLLEAFLTGAFATLLATPCSAPFVGTAVGFALAQGPGEILAIFLCLGIGMALPYGAAALFPGLVRWLPRPGPWMLTLRTTLGVLLLGTAAWLLLVLWSAAGGLVSGTSVVLLAALLVVLGLRARHSAAGRRWPGIVIAALAVAPVVVSTLPAASPAHATLAKDWQAFDAAAIPNLVANGKTVLVDVTATWCLTCKVNELAALDSADVRGRLGRADTVRMRADWSRPNAAIEDYLHRFGRYGIPLDVVYGPGRPAGESLPELLTPAIVLEALDRASGVSPMAAAPTP